MWGGHPLSAADPELSGAYFQDLIGRLDQAGVVLAGPARVQTRGREDAVTINATLQFLAAHGLDRVVDAYGIHICPWQTTAGARARAIATEDVAACRPPGAGGKPCWVTEWGINDTDLSCPTDDRAQAAGIAETMGIFRALAAQGRVRVALYFSWDNSPWATGISPSQIYRCGGLTPAGRLVLS